MPAGHCTQIRLKLGAGSNVVVDGVTYPLTVPSGLQSGYKLVGEFDVPASGLVELALDLDAARSDDEAPRARAPGASRAPGAYSQPSATARA